MAIAAPQFVRIADGVVAQVITRQLLPPTLDKLLASLFLITDRPLIVSGTRRACTEGEHDLRPWRTGLWRGAPTGLTSRSATGVVSVALRQCAFCGVVEVRDTSPHVMFGVGSGSAAHRHLNDLLGWYAGKRPLGRTFL